MKLHFVWIGKTKDRNCAALVDGYLERIKHFAPYEVSELKEQTGGADKRESGRHQRHTRMIAAESQKIISAIGRDDFVALLDEKGRELSSPQFAEFLDKRQQTGVKRLSFVIGGFAGVSDEVKQRADFQLALSQMTLTHELARVILTEQIYRAFTLLAGLPYHKF